MGIIRNLLLRLADGAPRVNEQTASQDANVSVGFGINYLSDPLPVSYDTYRTMRKDPTIALARAMAIAPIVAGEWMVEADDEIDEERVKFIQDQFLGIREPFIDSSLHGGIDFGWQPFEKIFEEKDGKIILKKLKPLYHDITTILVDQKTGAFQGFQQRSEDLPLANSLLISFRVEGTKWHGQSLLENIRTTYNQWTTASETAERYDAKLAGCQPVIKYPTSEEYVDDTKTPNKTLAKQILQGLEAGSGITIPRSRVKYVGATNEAKEDAWDVSLLTDSTTRQPGFRDRLDYLDKLKARGLQWPERSLLEGMFGTKAEAGIHQDLALTNADLIHRHVTRLLNWHCVDQILALNYGEDARGTVRLVAAPLVNIKLVFFREVLKKLLEKDAALMELYQMLDIDGLLDMLGLPKSEEVVQDDVDEGGSPSEPGIDVNDPLGVTAASIYRESWK
jgi:hypothetical protein